MPQPKRLIAHARHSRRALFALFALFVVVLSGVARAQSTSTRPTPEDRDQHVVFDDDLLNADLTTPFGEPVFSRQLQPIRVLLIAPRTSFVPELYKSVEHI
jgi:hypothetical protein